MANMKDVAKKAGVSVATVSAVVNNSKYVSDDLKERVLKEIEALGYRPNRIARSLKRKETKLIGVTVTEVTYPFYTLMLKGIEDVALEAGYNVILCTTGDNPKLENSMLESMIDQGVDGLVLATVDDEFSESLKLVEKEKVPLVLTNRAPENYKGSMVCVDSYKVGQLATNHLLDLGHREIAYFGGDRQNSREREKAYKDTLVARGIEVDPRWIFNGDYKAERSYQITKELIANGYFPKAFFAANDLMAFGIVKAFIDAGYKIPKDVSVIGSDNIPFSEDFRIPLTTVDVQIYEMGRKACLLLLKRLIAEEVVEVEQIILEPSLTLRETSYKPESAKV